MEFENIVGNEMKKTMIWKCEFVNHWIFVLNLTC